MDLYPYFLISIDEDFEVGAFATTSWLVNRLLSKLQLKSNKRFAFLFRFLFEGFALDYTYPDFFTGFLRVFYVPAFSRRLKQNGHSNTFLYIYAHKMNKK